jgi:hypothetical protein
VRPRPADLNNCDQRERQGIAVGQASPPAALLFDL